jgi:phytoene synthase
VTEAALAAKQVDEPFLALMRFQVERAREYFTRGRALLPLLPRRSRVCPAVLAGGYEEILRRIESRGFDVLHGRTTIGKATKLRIALGAWLKATLLP